jgi:predicted ArsR family transcriptional regulator
VRLKHAGPSEVRPLAASLGLSGPAVRFHLAQLEKDGWVARRRDEPGRLRRAGRPSERYALTPAGEELFPRAYDALLVAVVDAVAGELGEPALSRVLTLMTDLRVKALEARMAGRSLERKVEALKEVYAPGDPYVEVAPAPGGWRLIERNCPFLRVAMKRPLLCSTTVSVLTRLLDRPVVRERRFQDGDGCCVFRVYARKRLPAAPPRFAPEPALEPA